VDELHQLGHALKFDGFVEILGEGDKSHHLRFLLFIYLGRDMPCEKISFKPFLKIFIGRVLLLLVRALHRSPLSILRLTPERRRIVTPVVTDVLPFLIGRVV
jgi:hypothetical protein